MAGMTSIEDPLPKGVRSSNAHPGLWTVDNSHFVAGTARLVASAKLHGSYGACITRYGNEEFAEKVVSIVDMSRHLVVDHRMWLISEYGDEASRSVEVAMDMLTDDLMDYCERCQVGKVFIIDKLFPMKELGEKCPLCNAQTVRVPWQEC